MSEIKTAEDFLKSKGVKDTLYDRRQGIEANQWIKGGLSNLLNEFASQFQSKEHGEELKRLLIKESVVQQYSTAEQAAFQMGGDFILSKKALSLSPSLDKEKEELKNTIDGLTRTILQHIKESNKLQAEIEELEEKNYVGGKMLNNANRDLDYFQGRMKGEAVGFAEWIKKLEYLNLYGASGWTKNSYQNRNDKPLTTQELYQEFLKSK